MGRACGIAAGVLAVALGVYCLCVPTLALGMVGWGAAVALIADGIAKILLWRDFKAVRISDPWALAGGVASIVLGVAIAGSAGARATVDVLFATLVSAWLLLAGCVRIARSFCMRSATMAPGVRLMAMRWDLALVVGMAMVFLGILCVANPVVAMVTIGWQVGLSLVAGGVGLISATA